MIHMFHEMARQQVFASRVLLQARRRQRVFFLITIYLLIAAMGVATATVIAHASLERTVFLLAAGAGAALLGLMLAYCRGRLRQTNNALDQSLDVIAATRVMAIKNNVSIDEQAQLQTDFRDLQARRAKDLFGRRRALFYASHKSRLNRT